MWLLVDFGASYVKTAVFDLEEGSIKPTACIISPFSNECQLSLEKLDSFLIDIANKHSECEYILPCSIMGGGYHSGFYYSWKSNFKKHNNIDLISGAFTKSPTFHQHADHCDNGLVDIGPLATLSTGQIVYSNLADTECVRHSVPLTKSDYLINLGTGSQILGSEYTHSFIPAGRAFHVFNNFFTNFGFDIFNEFKSISLKDIKDSTMTVDLNVFPESHRFVDGGYIKNIVESEFTPKHFTSSLLRCFGDQYVSILKDLEFNRLYITGGISQKLPAVVKYISNELGKEVQVVSATNHSTHIGMANRLKGQLI